MGKKLFVVLPALVVSGSVAVTAFGGEPVEGVEEPVRVGALSADSSASASTPAAGSRLLSPAESRAKVESRSAALGCSFSALEPALAAQLGRAPGAGVVVESVQETEDGAENGLAPYDVVLSIEGQPVEEWLEQEQDGERSSLELRIIREGVLQTIVLGQADQGETQESAGFLSVDELSADHPFRLARTWQELGESYDESAEHFESLAETAKKQRRKAREEAKEAAKVLREQAAGEVQEAFGAYQAELLARVDASLGADALPNLQALALEPSALMSTVAVEAADAWFEEAENAFALALDGLPRVTGADDEQSERARLKFRDVAEESSKIFSQRVERVWVESRRSLESSTERLGPRALERAAWCAQKVEGIRQNLHERITCAYDRAAEQLDAQLAERLGDLDVPAAGELELAVEEIHLQVERMTEGFLERTVGAVTRFEQDIVDRNHALTSSVTASAVDWKQHAQQLRDDLEAVPEDVFGADALALDEGWRTTTNIDRLRGVLRTGWQALVTTARDSARTSLGRIPRELDEHQVACEDAWRDVQTLLGSAYSRSKNDCWKLDGPHLDGRFPERAGLKGEVAQLSE